MAKRPALIFDFGNVLVFFDYARAGAALGSRVGLSGAAFIEKARDLGFVELLKSYEAGAMTSEDFGRSLCGAMGLELPHEEFAQAWNDIFRINEPVARLAARLKALGYTLVLGSNTNHLHATYYREAFAEALSPFDALVLSYEVGHIKPSAPFYLACAEAAGADPADCLFIDDLPENIDGARAAGLQGVVFRDAATLVADLKRLGVEVPEDPSHPAGGESRPEDLTSEGRAAHS